MDNGAVHVARGALHVARGTLGDRIAPKRDLKWSQGLPNGSQGGPNGSQIDPKIDQKAFTLHLGEKGAEKVPKSCQNIEIAGPNLDQKSIKK